MKPMTRDTFGNVIFTMAAVLFFTVCLYLFRGSAENETGHAAMVWSLLVTIALAGGFRGLITVLKCWGSKR